MENEFKYTNKKGFLIFTLVWLAALIGFFIYIALKVDSSPSDTDSSSAIVLLLCVFVLPIILFLAIFVINLILLVWKEPYLVLDKNGIVYKHLHKEHQFSWKEIETVDIVPNSFLNKGLVIYFKPETARKTVQLNIMYLKLEKKEFMNRLKGYIK